MRRSASADFYLFPPELLGARSSGPLGTGAARGRARPRRRVGRVGALLRDAAVAPLPPLGRERPGRALGAGNLVLYETAEWARAQGYERFHLGGGAGGQEDSLAAFKRRFDPGGRLEWWLGKAVHDAEAYRELTGRDAATARASSRPTAPEGLARSLGLLPDDGRVAAEGPREPGEGGGGHEQVVVGDRGARQRQAQATGGGEAEPGELGGERRPVDAAAAGEREARAEERRRAGARSGSGASGARRAARRRAARPAGASSRSAGASSPAPACARGGRTRPRSTATPSRPLVQPARRRTRRPSCASVYGKPRSWPMRGSSLGR